jgi:hypothetical protein
MDTSNSSNPLHVRVVELTQSAFKVERDQVKEFEQTMASHLAEIAPVLEHICAPQTFRDSMHVKCVFVGEVNGITGVANRMIYLSEKGKFFATIVGGNDAGRILCTPGKGASDSVSEGRDDWKLLYFDAVITAMADIFEKASARKEVLLASVQKRSESLRRSVEAMKAPTNKP